MCRRLSSRGATAHAVCRLRHWRGVRHSLPPRVRVSSDFPTLTPEAPMLSRRTFIRTATAAAAAPLVYTPTSALAANEKLTLGFIGVGTQGRSHLGRFLGNAAVEVVAVCDVVKE